MRLGVRQTGGLPEAVEVFGRPRPEYVVREAPEIEIAISGCTGEEAIEIMRRLQGMPGVPVIDEQASPAAVLAALSPHFARRLDIE